MADLLCTFSFASHTADQSDAPTMGFAVHKEGALAGGDADQALTDIEEALNFLHGGQSKTVTGYLAGSVNRSVDTGIAKAFDITGHLNGEPHGSPIAVLPIEADAAASPGSMPSQVALVCSLRARSALTFPVEGSAGGVTTRPRQRHSGRLFLGPINGWGVNLGVNVAARPTTQFISDVLEGLEAVQDNLNAHGMAWCVWSRKNAAMSVIERVEIDDSFDVIRSRKVTATLRTPRVFAPVPSLALGA